MALINNHEYWYVLVHEKLSGYEKNNKDGSHDIHHFGRVARKALLIYDKTGIKNDEFDRVVITCAALLHDVVNIPKDDPDRSQASKLSADYAETILNSISFPKQLLGRVKHAIEAHSYSAGIKPTTIEAKCVQDADRLESLGALGIIRAFYVGYMCNRENYCKDDILAKNRQLDDTIYTLDHFNIKIIKLPGLMNTEFAKEIAIKHFQFILDFMNRVDRQEKGALQIIDDIIDCAILKEKLVGNGNNCLYIIMRDKLEFMRDDYYTCFYNQFKDEVCDI